jgi:hypothetical protein
MSDQIIDDKTDAGTSGEGEKGKDSRDWKASYNGLQRAYDKLKGQYDDVRAKYDALVADHETEVQKVRASETEKQALQKQIDDGSKLAETLKQEAASHKLIAQRAKLIAEKFSDLMEFEIAGNLPQASTMEELETKLTAFQTALQSRVAKTTDSKLKGTTVKTASGDGNGKVTRTKSEVYAELQQYAGATTTEDRRKFESLRDEWDKLNEES